MKKKTLGVIVGRFQVPDLHKGHLHLLFEAGRSNTNLLVLIGTTPVKNSPLNPLTFEDRYHMISSAYIVKQVETARLLDGKQVLADLTAQPLPDHANDAYWSEQLVSIITEEALRLGIDEEDVTCYGGRDSFLPYYVGPHKKTEVDELDQISGTAIRDALRPEQTRSYRVGRIIACQDRYPTTFGTIDAVIWNPNTDHFLIGRKKGMDKFCFIGGFVDPTDKSLEDAVRREVGEEVLNENLEPFQAMDTVYLGSFIVDDWRYRKGPDKIMTKVFACPVYVDSVVNPGDDLKGGEVRWVSRSELSCLIQPNHQPIISLIKAKLDV